LRIKFPKIPVTRFAHRFFATQFVQFENQTSFFLFRHERKASLTIRGGQRTAARLMPDHFKFPKQKYSGCTEE
jgi:hypothetical protein